MMMQLARVCMQRTAEEEAGVYPPYLANIEICQSTRNQWKVLHASSFCVTSCRSNMNLYPDTARINTGTVTPRDEAHRSRVMSGIFRISAINWSMAVGALWWPRVTSTWIKCQFSCISRIFVGTKDISSLSYRSYLCIRSPRVAYK